eukprot:gb/GECH01013122.1/.p1 GENE.gb/GECH01013122.1/~~gb/GECH01013122.1/.p1  ORF type:complete len:568 (+),score=112.87 gb/GECH01013122.1/:1-1704(+)
MDDVSAEEINPLMDRIHTLRIKRMNTKLTCTMCMLLLILIIAIMLIILSAFLIVFQQFPPLVNYYKTNYKVMPGFFVNSHAAVSAVDGYIRMGLGFEFTFQKFHNLKVDATIKTMEAVTVKENYTAITYSNKEVKGLGIAFGRADTTIEFNRSFEDQQVSVLDIKPFLNNESIAVLGYSHTHRAMFIASASVNYSPPSIGFEYDNPAYVIQYNASITTDVPFGHMKMVGPNEKGSQQRVIVLHGDPNSEESPCVLSVFSQSIKNRPQQEEWKLEDEVHVDPEGEESSGTCTGDLEMMQENALAVVVNRDALAVFEIQTGKQGPNDASIKREQYKHIQCSAPWEWAEKPAFVDLTAISNLNLTLSCISTGGSARIAYGDIGQIDGESGVILTNFYDLIDFVDTSVEKPLSVVSVQESQDLTATFVNYRVPNSRGIRSMRISGRGGAIASSKSFSHPLRVMEGTPLETISIGKKLGVVAIPEMGKATFGIELGEWHGGISWAGITLDNEHGGGKVEVVQRDISSGYSGLTPGAAYYALPNGTLSHAKTDTFVGVARSKSQLMIDPQFIG